MEVQLTVRYPNNATTTHRFTEEPITVGSAVANHIVLEEANVAPHQLIIFREGGEWVVRSLAPEPPVKCEDRPLMPGETRPLGHESSMVLQSFVFEWCSEAPPVGESKELARTDAEEPSAAAGSEVPSAIPDSLPPLRKTRRLESSSSPSRVAAPVGIAPEPAAAAAEVASAFDRLEDSSDALDATREAARESVAVAEETLETAPQPERPGSEPLSETPPFRATEPPLTTAPPATINPRITLQTFRRMYSFRAYPLLVNITQPAASSDEQSESAFVRVVPSLPGCLVTPPAARLDIRRAAVGIRFWVTPMVLGRQKDGFIDVAWQGSPPARLKLPFRVVQQWPAKLLGAFAVLAIGLAYLWEKFPSVRPEELEVHTPEVVRRYLAEGVNAVGGVTNLGFAVAGILMVLAIAAFTLRRPRSMALTASRPRS